MYASTLIQRKAQTKGKMFLLHILLLHCAFPFPHRLVNLGTKLKRSVEIALWRFLRIPLYVLHLGIGLSLNQLKWNI